MYSYFKYFNDFIYEENSDDITNTSLEENPINNIDVENLEDFKTINKSKDPVVNKINKQSIKNISKEDKFKLLVAKNIDNTIIPINFTKNSIVNY